METIIPRRTFLKYFGIGSAIVAPTILLPTSTKFIFDVGKNLWKQQEFSENLCDPLLIPTFIRLFPNMIAHDICGVQPMTDPIGLIFALKSRYTSHSYTLHG